MGEANVVGGGGTRRAELQERFTELWMEHEGRVRTIVAAGKCDDPDGLVGEVARKWWQAFPVTVRRERKRVKEGWPG